MSWKFGGIYFKKDFSANPEALIEAIGYPLVYSDRHLPFADVLSSSFMDTAIGYVNGCTLLHNNFMIYDCSFHKGKTYQFDEELAALSEQMDIIAFFFDGNTDSYGLLYFSGGKLTRKFGIFSGEWDVDEGEDARVPPPGSVTTTSEAETMIFGVMDAFTGKPFQQLLDKPSHRMEIYSE